MEIISPDDQKKKIVHTLKIISPATLGKVLMAGERNLRELLMADEGPSRSVGLPELTDGREVPPPHEPEEDLFPGVRSSMEERGSFKPTVEGSSPSGLAGSNAGAAQEPEPSAPAQAERGRSTPEVAGPSPASRSETDLQARAEELFAELNVPAKERQIFRNAHRGRAGDLVAFLEKQVEKRKK